MPLNRIDLDLLDADVATYVQQVNPRARVLSLSARTGDGMAAWFGWLRDFARPADVAKVRLLGFRPGASPSDTHARRDY